MNLNFHPFFRTKGESKKSKLQNKYRNSSHATASHEQIHHATKPISEICSNDYDGDIGITTMISHLK
ncbi:hypothetical protein Csa_006810 [Cucumis sativus]|uniref:Uncharacterized protein n=1 Tax=Cucumis sativus TaxID=3659 RepID=A0A0A0LIA1_CUCSA|nr:hypothetical protein Csa_006810 [Cucumis sativus]